MTAALVIADALPLQNFQDMKEAAMFLHQASCLGASNPAEGFVILASSRQMGMSLPAFQQKFHFRQGRFSMSAHSLLSEFAERGGVYKILSRTAERAAVEFTKGANKYTSELTWAQAEQEPFVYRGKESDQLAELDKPVAQRQLKAKYKTPRSRMQMLWARAISDGVVVIDPGARTAYTHEELADVIEAEGERVPAKPVAIDPVETAKRVNAVVMDAQPQPRPVATQAKTEPSPFHNLSTDHAADFVTCPIPKCSMTDKPWAEMDLAILNQASTMQHPAMLPGHYEAIKAAIAAKEAEEKA